MKCMQIRKALLIVNCLIKELVVIISRIYFSLEVKSRPLAQINQLLLNVIVLTGSWWMFILIMRSEVFKRRYFKPLTRRPSKPPPSCRSYLTSAHPSHTSTSAKASFYLSPHDPSCSRPLLALSSTLSSHTAEWPSSFRAGCEVTDVTFDLLRLDQTWTRSRSRSAPAPAGTQRASMAKLRRSRRH